jgi:hypothetical protein
MIDTKPLIGSPAHVARLWRESRVERIPACAEPSPDVASTSLGPPRRDLRLRRILQVPAQPAAQAVGAVQDTAAAPTARALEPLSKPPEHRRPKLDRQLAMLKATGCKRVFKEKQSGRDGIRRLQLEKAIEAQGPNDVLILAEWDRATRSMLDGIRIIERVAARGASLKALDRPMARSDYATGQTFLSALAEDERARILERANGGRAAAKKKRRQIRA